MSESGAHAIKCSPHVCIVSYIATIKRPVMVSRCSMVGVGLVGSVSCHSMLLKLWMKSSGVVGVVGHASLRGWSLGVGCRRMNCWMRWLLCVVVGGLLGCSVRAVGNERKRIVLG